MKLASKNEKGVGLKKEALGRMMGSRRFVRCRMRTLMYIMCLVMVAGVICFYTNLDFSILRGFGFQIETILVKVFDNDVYALKTNGCYIQKYDPFDRRISRFFKKLYPLKCPQNAVDLLIYLEKGVLAVFPKARNDIIAASQHWLKNKPVKFSCRKWAVYRNPIEKTDDVFRISENYTEFQDFLKIDDEYVKVQCFMNGQEIYHNYFFNIIRKREVEKKCTENEKQFLKAYPNCTDRLSVMVVGIDSVAKTNFIRQFPKTYDLILNNYSALDFNGYVKVGLNTFPCLMPYLLGGSYDELKSGCWGGGMNMFDNCTTLWDTYESAGYRTAFVENMNNYGLFTYNKAGFKRQPAHYYGRTLLLPVMKHVKHFFNGCWRGASDDQNVVLWMYHFQKTFQKDAHFGHFWLSRFTHDDVNTAQHDDPYLADTLAYSLAENHFNSTLLILMSDHGIRYGGFRETEWGRLEENLPFMFMAFPEWFKKKYPRAIERLQKNTDRLITTHDLHETLKSILYCDYKDEEFMSVTDEFREKGVSLFHNISPNRTCDDAGIPAIYCACEDNVDHLSVSSPLANELSDLVLKSLNHLTSEARNICVKFEVKAVLSFKKVKSANQSNASVTTKLENSYIVAILTKPGDAKFEATIQKWTANSTYIVHPDIRRINRYGRTSECIKNDGLLKSICYCKGQKA